MHVTTINVLPTKECDRPHSIWLWDNGNKPETSFILSLSYSLFLLSNWIFIFRRSRISIAPVQQLVKLRATGEETRSVEKNMATTKYRHNDCATMRFKSQMKCEIDAQCAAVHIACTEHCNQITQTDRLVTGFASSISCDSENRRRNGGRRWKRWIDKKRMNTDKSNTEKGKSKQETRRTRPKPQRKSVIWYFYWLTHNNIISNNNMSILYSPGRTHNDTVYNRICYVHAAPMAKRRLESTSVWVICFCMCLK